MFLKAVSPYIIIGIVLYRLLIWYNDKNEKEFQNSINQIPSGKTDAFTYDSLIKDSIKLLPKDTSKYHGNWVDVNN